jgi:uncharacterized protein (DUF2141 family)
MQAFLSMTIERTRNLMNRRPAILCFFGACALGFPSDSLAPLAAAATDSNATLRLDVSGFRNASGALGCRLFTQLSDFPDGEGMMTVRATIAGDRANCTFSRLAAGDYAVAVVHDENDNGRLDRNALGVPREGYGVTNNHTYALSLPKWDESKFSLAMNERAVMRVKLRY